MYVAEQQGMLITSVEKTYALYNLIENILNLDVQEIRSMMFSEKMWVEKFCMTLRISYYKKHIFDRKKS